MIEDHSWRALMKPGETEVYFDLPGLPPFPTPNGRFDPLLAYYCAEFCRLVYRQGGDEGGGRLPTRKQILNRIQLDELAFVHGGNSAAMIVEAPNGWRIVAFRGTDDLRDWLTNIDIVGLRNHLGFALALRRIWSGIIPHIENTEGVVFTGHSLGGSLAVLAANNMWFPHVYTFGAARASRGLKLHNAYRIVNHKDMVPVLPLPFEHVGELHYFNHNGELKVKPSGWRMFGDGWRLCRKVDTGKPAEALSDHAPINYSARLERRVRGVEAEL